MNPSKSSRIAQGALVLALLAGVAPAGAASGGSRAARIVLPNGVVPVEYRVAIEPHAETSTFDGAVDIDLRVARATDRIVLNSAELQFD